MAEIGVTLEPMRPDDLPFVKDSWVRSYDPGLTGIEAVRYIKTQRAFVDRLVQNVVTVARHGSQLCGWLCSGGSPLPRIDYIYVKSIFRGQDIASALLENSLGDATEALYSHDTKQWRGLMHGYKRTHVVEFHPIDGTGWKVEAEVRKQAT
jgi:GNAT superfamily N-acetyltransferase